MARHGGLCFLALQDHWGDLAVDKFGSHVLQRAWHCCELADKKQMAKELLKVEKQLEESLYGRIVFLSCRLSQYRNEPKRWEEQVTLNRRKVEVHSWKIRRTKV